jgi:2-hydroxychromene-2-carboxylate isomerase
MGAPIDFYFDYSSPYGYLASCRIEALAARHDREVIWHPILLGAVFKVTGGQPLPTIPLKGEYVRRDTLRCARHYGIPLKIPSKFPVATQAPARATYWVWDRDPAQAKALAAALFRAYFVEDQDISSPEVTVQVAATVGLPGETLRAVLQAPAVKERLRVETDAALARGVFGSPFFIVDGEPFWGVDRMDQLERWLETGGW